MDVSSSVDCTWISSKSENSLQNEKSLFLFLPLQWRKYVYADVPGCFSFCLNPSDVIYTYDFTFILLLLSNDVEKNPGK